MNLLKCELQVNKLLLNILTAFSLITNCFASSVCPSSDDLLPCECFPDASVLCSDIKTHSRITDSRLINAFARLNQNYSESFVEFQSIIISETSITKIDDQIFQKISFQRFRLEQNYYLNLNSIHRNALIASRRTLNSFSASNYGSQEQPSPSNGDGDVFEMFDEFNALNTLTIIYYKLPHIPRSAFGRSELKRLRNIALNDNDLESIGDYAFYRLPNLSWLSLSFNKIRRITNYTFASESPSQQVLRLELSFNRLTVESFESGWYEHLNRPVKLELYNNMITYLDRKIFGHFLDHFNETTISLKGNPVKCDCKMKWLLDKKENYKNKIHDLICQNGKELWDFTGQQLLQECKRVTRSQRFEQMDIATNRAYSRGNSSILIQILGFFKKIFQFL